MPKRMQYLSEFRQPSSVEGLVAAIRHVRRPARIMEVCGGHTHAICTHGLAALLPPEVQLVHGPGCPVCIVPPHAIAAAAVLADRPGVTVACFGDIMRVPSPRGTLLSRARGSGSVRMVYSPLDALALAQSAPDRLSVFMAIGFETTAPLTAIALRRASQSGVENFAVLSAHYRVPPVLRALMGDPSTRVDAFIAPGHVSAIIGLDAYRFLATDYGCPVVVAGFEPLDILLSVLMILEQLHRGEATVANQYRRAVSDRGNQTAQEVLDQTFVHSAGEWRGLGTIPESHLAIAPAFSPWDAAVRVPIPEDGGGEAIETGCRCGDVLRGTLHPRECGLFASTCTPDDPQGPCMVSAEGTCAAYFRYGIGVPHDS